MKNALRSLHLRRSSDSEAAPHPENSTLANQAPSKGWLIAFFALAITATTAALFTPDQGLVRQFYFHLIIAISVAGIASIIPGFLTIEVALRKNLIRAGGAIGVFVLIYFVNPASLSDSFRPTVNLSGDWNFYLQSSEGDVPGGVANIDHRQGDTVFVISGNVEANPIAPADAYNTPVITFDSDFAMLTDRRINFHYRTNQGEEGMAVASYNSAQVDELFFNFRDYSETDDDGFASGVLIFRRVQF